MPGIEIEYDPADFITIGTLGPKGRRVFYLQVAKESEMTTLIMEKQQAKSLGDAIHEMLESLSQKYPDHANNSDRASAPSTALREPVEPLFRISQLGLGYDEERNMIILVAQELVVVDEETDREPEPRVVRVWATREQMRALSEHAEAVVRKGRADPKTNGYMIYYWT